MPTKREKVRSYPSHLLREFILEEVEGDTSRIPRKAAPAFYKLSNNDRCRTYFYTADELLLACGSHLRFFEDWLEQRTTT